MFLTIFFSHHSGCRITLCLTLGQLRGAETDVKFQFISFSHQSLPLYCTSTWIALWEYSVRCGRFRFARHLLA